MDQSLILFGIAALNCFTAIVTWQTNRLAKQVEVATNSMKDALVAKTAEASHAAGKEEGRVEGEVRAALVAEGVKQGSSSGNLVGDRPLPVADDRTATATERTATASERVADAAERTVEAEVKLPKK